MNNRTVVGLRMLSIVQDTEQAPNDAKFPRRLSLRGSRSPRPARTAPFKNVREYHRNGLTNHPYVSEEFRARICQHALSNWNDLSYEDKCEFTEMVELYSEGDEYMAPSLNQTGENFDAFIANHSSWLQQNVKPEHSA